MTIHYESLTLQNFGPYYGEQVLQFAPRDGGTPVTLVDGKNGFGKTTVLKAFRWLLYGQDDPEERQKVINRTASGESGETKTKVQLTLRRNNEVHQIIRSLKAPKGVSYEHFEPDFMYLVDGAPQGNPTSKIRELLPEPASQFFFFDGARISRYADMENSQEVRDSIELVLGIPAYENAVDHLGRLRRRWEKKARKEQAGHEDTKALASEVEKLENREESLEKTIEKAERERRRLQERKEDVLADYKKYEGLKDRISTIQQKEADLERYRERLQEIKKTQAQEVRHAAQEAVIPILKEAFSKKQERLENLKEKQDTVLGRRLVSEFLEKVEEKTDDPTVRQAIPDLQEYVDEFYAGSGDGLDDRSLAELQVEVGRLEEKMRSIRHQEGADELNDRYRQTRARVAQYESELKSLRRNLGDLDEEKAIELQQELEEINQALGSVDERIRDHEDRLDECGEELRAKKRKLSSMSTTSKAERYEGLASTAGDYEEGFETVIDLVRNRKRSSIEEHATQIFRNLTRKPEVYDKFRINDDYTLSLLDEKGVEHRRDMISAGEKQLVALSFIVGLMRSTRRVAPLVIDMPFGHLDQLHRRNVIEHLPEIDQQLVFLITDADVSEEHEPLLNRHVGRKYVIRYDSDRQVSSLAEVKA